MNRPLHSDQNIQGGKRGVLEIHSSIFHPIRSPFYIHWNSFLKKKKKRKRRCSLWVRVLSRLIWALLLKHRKHFSPCTNSWLELTWTHVSLGDSGISNDPACYWLELRCWQGRAPSTYFKMLAPQWPPPLCIYLQELQNKCQMLSNKRKKLSVWILKVSGSAKTQNSSAKMWTKSSMNNFPNDFLSSRSFWIIQRTWPYLLKTAVLLSSEKKAEVKDKVPSKMRCYLRTLRDQSSKPKDFNEVLGLIRLSRTTLSFCKDRGVS